jgi:hypothetical protein
MKLLHSIRNLFAPANIDSIIDTELPLEQHLVIQCETMIEQLEFQKFLAIAKIAALKAWQQQKQDSKIVATPPSTIERKS